MSNGRLPRVLIFRALGLGDLLTAIPALRALRRAFPDHHLELAVPAALHELAEASGAVDRAIDARPFDPLPEWLREPEVAVNLHGKGPQSHAVLSQTAPEVMLAFRNEEAGFFQGPAWIAAEHERVRWCGLLDAFGITADPQDMYIQLPTDERRGALAGATLIHPGAASPARRWPVERFAAVARNELRAGRQVLITGSTDERDLALSVAAQAGLPLGACLAGRTTVMELTAVVAAAGRVLCGDTGIAHLAAALRTPSVILFGPTSPEMWGPPPGPHIALWSGRTGDPHGSEVHPGLLEIEVDKVIGALRAS